MTSKNPGVIIRAAKPLSIPRQWGQIEPHLSRAIRVIDSGHSVNDVVRNIMSGRSVLWNIDSWRAIAVTQICKLPQHSVLAVEYLGGSGMSRWLPTLVDTLKHYQAVHGCKYGEVYGRLGWDKVLTRYGLTKTYTVTRFENDGRQKRADADAE